MHGLSITAAREMLSVPLRTSTDSQHIVVGCGVQAWIHGSRSVVEIIEHSPSICLGEWDRALYV